MGLLYLAEMNWTQVRDLAAERLVVILPLGAVEAHGPHLPLITDRVIAGAMARSGARRLYRAGWQPLLLPSISYTSAGFAADFPGTVSLRPETERALLVDLLSSFLDRCPARCVAIANAHLDPGHLRAVEEAAEVIRQQHVEVAFPNLTRKPWALRLTEEFQSGACHAGQFESSIVLAEQPQLVDRALAWRLPPNASSLSVAIREGKTNFVEAGGPRAYFGNPAAATAQEGRETVEILGRILADSVREILGDP
jgi:creatinine amidohydrolase